MIFFNLILKYPEYQACVQPSLDILLKIIKVKKNEVEELIEIINSEKFLKVLKMIISIHSCNMKILNEIFLIFYQIGDRADFNSFLYLFSFNKLNEIFNLYNLNSFDYIHEIIIRIIKYIINKKQNVLKKNSDEKKNSNNLSFIEEVIEIISNQEFIEINIIFINALLLMKNKIITMDISKHPKQLVNILINANFMLDILVVILNNHCSKIIIVQNLKTFEFFLNFFLYINETKFFSDLEGYFSRNDPNLVNNKVLILKILSNIVKILRIIKEKIPKVLVILFF